MAAGLHISISAERVTSFGPLNISNSILTSLIATALIAAFCFALRWSLDPKAKKPKGLQNFSELLVEGMYGIVQGVTGNHKKTRVFMPLFLSFFIFILLNNWLGLLPGVGTIGFKETAEGTQHAMLLEKEVGVPVAQAVAAETLDHAEAETMVGGESLAIEEEHPEEAGEHHEEEGMFVPYFRAGTADLNTTLALGIFTMGAVQVFGVKYLGLAYFKKFLNFKNPILFFVSILELISEIAKVISFSFRLFGNIFAGEVLLAVLAFLIPLVAPMPFFGMEIFVGLIQALVFSLLSVVFFNVATISHDDH